MMVSQTSEMVKGIVAMMPASGSHSLIEGECIVQLVHPAAPIVEGLDPSSPSCGTLVPTHRRTPLEQFPCPAIDGSSEHSSTRHI